MGKAYFKHYFFGFFFFLYSDWLEKKTVGEKKQLGLNAVSVMLKHTPGSGVSASVSVLRG